MSAAAIGGYIQTMRKHAGLSQDELARRLDVTGKSVSDWERGESLPGAATLRRLVGVLKGSWEDIGALLDPNVTAEDGRARAEAWLCKLDAGDRKAFEDRVDATPIAERERIAEDLRRMAEEILQGRSGRP